MFRAMSDIRLVLYKNNRAPRSIALSTRMIYRTMALAMLGAFLLVVSTGAAIHLFLAARAKTSQATSASSATADENDIGPSNSADAQNKSLRDEIELLRVRLQNTAAAQAALKEIDKKNPALALFSPLVTDRTQSQDQVRIANFSYSKNRDKTSTLTFELHNAHEGESTEKGYLVVLARGTSGLFAYPNTFAPTGPYLLDFERGETFQVARFRMVNAQFEAEAQHFQVLIFTRKGELLINTMHEVNAGGT